MPRRQRGPAAFERRQGRRARQAEQGETMSASLKWIRTAGSIVLLVGLVVRPAVAHHSFTAEFDPEKPIKLTGKVTLMKWANPHAWIYIDVTGADGKTVNW